ncbi:MAG TPA: beta-ketoacyl-[acyl-carrier-protein] synthase II [Ruminiclostridium sp.]|jgi:3-oxoacyl-[acyl-carrier-protein] synthase II|uniref:3-oxoacyl-[acyl-carrier-protein] synthase 2 n=1 Tax=Acetivibrio saccincola TaxID=1677857 RepID=A0A2K9E5J4_9FIRM|nr:beta-ketoacyl-ACP synthase II [Acetivibrio saccincola]HAA43056.1 beta-ketoacyl-[acyl-carrier-protein] synthase II [Ruminiclostridium sp.]AUG57648.1 3-oxoacyl-[acyl-carrier-protein] synthase 2 [Acetivibrio saccincola]NLW26177.1 beta-ketoacyl-ACP synthase II [Acetivibrio saccincola]HOA96687.1 beta-ketoacyl-ACP synthase II [Acetivibrio saccincola]HQD28429.1 beta-ketoacyl-ACP synthase II [Acetivibrio saccincola]
MKRRVVVTGVGAVTPIGNNAEDFWNSVKKGVCGIDYPTLFDVKNTKAKLFAEVKDLKLEDHFSKKQILRSDRFCQFGIIAAREAFIDAGLSPSDIDKRRLGVVMGNGVGGINTIVKETINLHTGGMNMVSPLLIPKSLSNILAGSIAIEFGAKGICNAIITACAAGANAIGEAMRSIQYGYADIVICGGSEACINPLMAAGFTNMNALTLSEDKSRASIPFDRERSGFVMGEGAGVLILEEYSHALRRNAKIYAEVAGYGFTSDAYHLTAPAPLGEGAARAMELALSDASMSPCDISYINAHGTSTVLNDKYETMAIKEVFGDLAYSIPVNSTKSMIGHLLGAAGAVEAVVCVKSIEDGFIHETLGYREKDSECDLDYVENRGREEKVKAVLSNSFGFGGHNASIIFKKV